ncbi:MAG: TIGR00730 family Rossman fold protein [Ilumatobacteraceae bacterium]
MSINICVYCGSSSGGDPVFADRARSLGARLAGRDIGLVYGGGRVGLMGIVADAVLGGGGRVFGVIPRHLVDMEASHAELTELDVVDSMHSRKARMEQLSTGFIVLPGGLGTFDEVFEILTWNQLGLIAKPVVFLDVDGYFAPLFHAFDHMIDAGFVSPDCRQLLQRVSEVDMAIDVAIGPAPVIPAKLRDLDVTSKRSLQ